jgi:dATP pyrophosphohydrolase
MNVRYDMVSCHVVRPDDSGRSHEFLQLRRAAADYMGGTWQTMRGTAHPGETASQAALRELREETGLTPKEFYRLSFLESFYLVHDETIWHCPCFVAVVARDARVVLNEEHEAFRWTPRDRIEAETMWAGERQVVAEICRDVLDEGPAKPYLRLSL